MKQHFTRQRWLGRNTSLRLVVILLGAGAGLGMTAKFADENSELLGSVLSGFAPYALLLALLAQRATDVAESVVTTVCFFAGILAGYYGFASAVLRYPVSQYQGVWLLAIGFFCAPVAALLVLARKRQRYEVIAYSSLSAVALTGGSFGRFILFLRADPSVNARGVLLGAVDGLFALAIVFLLPSWGPRTVALILLAPAYVVMSMLVAVPYQLGILG